MITKIKNEDIPNPRKRKHKSIKKEDPTNDEIQNAIEEYLKKGGTITKVEPLFLDDFDFTFS